MGDSTVGSSYDSVKGTYWKYDAIVNGEITTIESAQKITSKGMYTTVAEDKNGVLTLSGNDGVTSGTGTRPRGQRRHRPERQLLQLCQGLPGLLCGY